MAPEQAAADTTTDHRADIYSFGIMAYEMLTGQVPFRSKTPQALLAAQLTATPAPIALRRTDVPVALARLIMRCLEKEREKRPQSARELAEMLEHPDMVSGAFASASVDAVKRRDRRLAVVAAMVFVAAIGGGILWKQRNASESTVVPVGQPTGMTAAERARSLVDPEARDLSLASPRDVEEPAGRIDGDRRRPTRDLQFLFEAEIARGGIHRETRDLVVGLERHVHDASHGGPQLLKNSSSSW